MESDWGRHVLLTSGFYRPVHMPIYAQTQTWMQTIRHSKGAHLAIMLALFPQLSRSEARRFHCILG